MKNNLRLLAAKTIDAVTNGKSLADCLEPTLAKIPDPRDRAFVQAVCYGVCRYYTQLDVILSELLQKPMNAKDSDVHALLCVGLYQLIHMRVGDHAAVSETVNAVGELNKDWARGLVNAVLRNYLRNKSQLTAIVNKDEEALYAHPAWWINGIRHDWPKHWKEILNANNQHPPLSLRVNLSKTSRDAYLEKLKANDIAAEIITETNSGIKLASPIPVEEIPDFGKEVHVQDGASQLAAGLLELHPGLRVLDACAAPGGKLAHMLELEPNLAEIVAIEIDEQRIKLLPSPEKITAICADAAETKTWWDGKEFDRILLDAPCSASGIIRRHPDIKLLRDPDDLKSLAKEQLKLINALWPLLKVGGILLYSTCSIFPEENKQVIEAFLKSQTDAKVETIQADWGVNAHPGRQILPGNNDLDGFYYARLVKFAS